MNAVTQFVVWLNSAADPVGRWLLAPVGALPFVSATLVAVVTGLLLLVVFKYTSPQRAIKRVRDDINASLLALKLFKDSAAVALRSQGRLLLGAGRLLVLSLVPTAVMIVPVTLFLGQLSLWYQQRPLKVGEEAVVTLQLNETADLATTDVRLRPTDAVETTVGPVRVFSRREVCWNIKARDSGYHRLVFQVGDQEVEKELAVGDGFMRVTALRPAWVFSDVVLHPGEPPFATDSLVQSIDVAYPERFSWKICGIEPWLLYWFVVSMVSGLCFSRVLKVNI
jgi:hypothetical protein